MAPTFVHLLALMMWWLWIPFVLSVMIGAWLYAEITIVLLMFVVSSYYNVVIHELVPPHANWGEL